MQRLIRTGMLAAAGLLLFSSCTKQPLDNLSEEESRIYITNHDEAAAFNNYKTYSIVDSVSVIDNNRFAGKQTTAWDVAMIAAIKSAMDSRGFVRVDKSQSPNLGVNISRVYNTTTNLVDLSGYYGGYGGYYDPYYWGYSGYDYYFPPAYGYYQSTEGMASVDILDLKNATGSNTIKGVWNGVIRGTGIFNSSAAVNTAAKALFDQSPYLKTAQ